MDDSHVDNLEKIGRFICIKQMFLFSILLLYTCHITYSSFSCPICGIHAQLICKIFMATLLLVITAMFILAFILSLGISMRQADFLRPWLATNIVMVIMCIVMLVMTNDVMQIILGTMVLLFQGISWYPIYKLYHRYYDEGKARDEEHSSSDNFLMTNGGLESTAAPYYADIDAYPMRFHYEEPPPTYEQVMGIESQPPSFSDLHNCAGT